MFGRQAESAGDGKRLSRVDIQAGRCSGCSREKIPTR